MTQVLSGDVLALALAAIADRFIRLPNALHPVAWFGAIAKLLVARAPTRGRVLPGLVGLSIALGLPVLVILGSRFVLALVAGNGVLRVAVQAFLLHASFTLFGLLDAAQKLASAYGEQGLWAARERMSWLCSRDASALGPSELANGTLESLAENLSDSVVAPLCFLLCFGVEGALAYRAINTLDAMIGYRGHYEWLGKAAARIDDLVNLIPARLTVFCLALAGMSMPQASGISVARAVPVWWAERLRTASPNAGHPMAMAAGLLGLRYDKPGDYVLGAAFRAPEIDDIGRGIALTRRAGLFAITLTLIALGLRSLGGGV